MTDIQDTNSANDSTLSTIGDAVGDLIAGVPAPIRKNAWKAFGRLCTAAVEYPVALIEGVVAEKRAETRARVHLIDVSANQIAEQMKTDPEYARSAATKFAQKIVRERVNVDKIAGIAADELNSATTTQDITSETVAISDDWLNVFESEAAQMSSEQMQHLFGKILAGEIRKPSSYSLRTIKLMAQLDNKAASLFRLLCSLSISLRTPESNEILDARVVSIDGDAATNSLGAYGLNFSALNTLHEYGLIIADYNSYSDYQVAVAHNNKINCPLIYQNISRALIPNAIQQQRQKFTLHGVAFSQSGKELLSIVDIEPNESYSKALTEFLHKKGMTMVMI
ncbi:MULTISPECIES: DUF2806 domain-containing protein [Burkholderiales]|uniref:DUF2806 domain-containing protein n=1 Tax=Burkholderiales TaxID=80840 RepID=UPI0029D62C6B|nr:DUF2806 domain-containing protein [Achromobacter sp.]MCG2602349.1 DUF2806 domain-containing protein [Achromobacter sp.]